MKFIKRTHLPVSAEKAYAWHEEPGALATLIPPWQKVHVISHQGIRDGALAELAIYLGPFRTTWVARHQDVLPGRQFTDVQTSGPFHSWTHIHRFIPEGPEACTLEDEVTCTCPGGRWMNALARPFLTRTLVRLFDYRHRVTLRELGHRG